MHLCLGICQQLLDITILPVAHSANNLVRWVNRSQRNCSRNRKRTCRRFNNREPLGNTAITRADSTGKALAQWLQVVAFMHQARMQWL
jgi:hypothetical protein